VYVFVAVMRTATQHGNQPEPLPALFMAGERWRRLKLTRRKNMGFTVDGKHNVEIIGTAVTAAKFAPEPALDVWLQIQGADGASDWWRGEISTNYGRGNFADRTQAQITGETLQSIGYQLGGDLSQLNTLVGVKTTATIKRVEKDGNVYYNVSYIGGSSGNGPDAALSAAEIAQRVASMIAPAPAAAPTASTPAAGNPFAPR